MISSAVLAVTVLVLASLGLAARTPTTVTVTAGKPSELSFALSKRTVSAGAVTFAVVNGGDIGHDFKIAGKKSPTVAGGANGTLRVTITKAGKYPYICTQPSHKEAGMRGTLTVR